MGSGKLEARERDEADDKHYEQKRHAAADAAGDDLEHSQTLLKGRVPAPDDD